MSAPLNVAVIGCGYSAEMHLPAICSLPTARLVALADSDPGRLETQANRHQVQRRHLDWRELVHDPTIDVIAVLTPPALHFEMAREAIRQGKHVMVEKPVVVTTDQADLLIQEASSSRARVAVAYNLRFHAQIQELRELIRRGDLGSLEFVRGVATSPTALRANFPSYRKSRDLAGGAVVELGVHYYDLWEHLLDSRLRQVAAMSRSTEADDVTAFVGGRTESGVLVSAEFSLRGTEQHEIEVYGDRARAIASLYRFDGLRVFPQGTHMGDAAHRLRHLRDAVRRLPDGLRARSGGGVFLDSFRRQWRYFLDCVRSERPVEPDLADGRRSLAIALAAVRAADTGEAVELAGR